jgi:pimeloyl-ACP methyl ester carboxylesterase
MPFFKIEDCNLFYEQSSGSVPASLLLLHGSGGSHSLWRRQMDLDCNITSVDLPGHGLSSPLPCGDIAETARITAAILGDLQRPVFLAGHSLGAAVTLYTALNYPELIKGIILVGGGARLRVLPDVLKSLARGNIDPNFLRIAFSPNASAQLVEEELNNYSKCNVSTLYSDLTCCDHFEISSQLGNIQTPALVIVGKEDKLTPVKYSEYLCACMPDAELAVVENAGHLAMLEQPQCVNTLINQFISRHL